VERPERFPALHFGDLAWEAPSGEVMPHPGTSTGTADDRGKGHDQGANNYHPSIRGGCHLRDK
jgi:hypothetical protein